MNLDWSIWEMVGYIPLFYLYCLLISISELIDVDSDWHTFTVFYVPISATYNPTAPRNTSRCQIGYSQNKSMYFNFTQHFPACPSFSSEIVLILKWITSFTCFDSNASSNTNLQYSGHFNEESVYKTPEFFLYHPRTGKGGHVNLNIRPKKIDSVEI